MISRHQHDKTLQLEDNVLRCSRHYCCIFPLCRRGLPVMSRKIFPLCRLPSHTDRRYVAFSILTGTVWRARQEMHTKYIAPLRGWPVATARHNGKIISVRDITGRYDSIRISMISLGCKLVVGCRTLLGNRVPVLASRTQSCQSRSALRSCVCNRRRRHHRLHARGMSVNIMFCVNG